MTLYGYARVSVREPEDKNLDLQVERLVRAGCAMGNIRAEEASGAKDDRGGLLELLDLVAPGDTLVVTHIDRLSRGLTYGLQVIEGLHHAGRGVPVPVGGLRHGHRQREAPTPDGAGLQRVVAQLHQGALGGGPRPRHGLRAVSLADGRSSPISNREYIREQRSRGVSQRELAKRLEVSRWTIQQVDG